MSKRRKLEGETEEADLELTFGRGSHRSSPRILGEKTEKGEPVSRIYTSPEYDTRKKSISRRKRREGALNERR